MDQEIPREDKEGRLQVLLYHSGSGETIFSCLKDSHHTTDAAATVVSPTVVPLNLESLMKNTLYKPLTSCWHESTAKAKRFIVLVPRFIKECHWVLIAAEVTMMTGE